jgi:hypothetical protein
MAEVTSRLELKEYCLRQLGYPVIDINIADQQLEDRIDDALQFFNEWHFDGAEKIYMKHQMTATQLKFAAAVPASSFRMGDTVTGATGHANAIVWKQATDNLSIFVWQTTNGQFVNGESVANLSFSTNLAATNAIVLGDLDKQYLDIPNAVMSITKIFPISATTSSNYLFNEVYYQAFDLLFNFNGMDLVSYELMKERINQLNQMLVGQKPIRFNRHTEKLYIDFDWKKAVAPDMFLIIECTRILDPEVCPKVWNDYFLKQYCTALIRIQWGNNISKYAGIQLPGGVTLDGPRILEQGKAEKLELEEQMKTGRWAEPLGFFVG